MKKSISITLLIIASLMFYCGSDEEASSTSSTTLDIVGTWTICYDSGGNGKKDTWTFASDGSSNTFTLKQQTYTDSGATATDGIDGA